MKVTVNNKREPLELEQIKADYVCPTCKNQLWFNDAINDGTDCDCGIWWYNPPSSWKSNSTSLMDDSGWHFKSKDKS